MDFTAWYDYLFQAWTDVWALIYRSSGESPFVMCTQMTLLINGLVFILGNAFFVYVDLMGRPLWMRRYKVQPQVNFPVPWDKYKKCMKVVSVNMFLASPLFVVLIYPLAQWRGNPCGYDLPSFGSTLLHYTIGMMLYEICFYTTHRILHHRLIYRHIHKLHHEWTSPISIASIYTHPIEYLVGNLLSVYSGYLLVGSHLAVLWMVLITVTVLTIFHHSGYHLPLMASSEFHDFHHNKNSGNFSAFGIMDRFLRTDILFLLSNSFKRNFVLFGTLSAREIHPDTPTSKKTI